MKINGKIITVGSSPAWDITCRGSKLNWGGHKVVSSCSNQPAGKALNISRALAWMGQRNTAAGLWGRQDYEQMLKAMRQISGLVKVKMTCADGQTRHNVTVIDSTNNREMHLRAPSRLASKKTLKKLQADLQAIVTRNSVCVFSGSMPEGELLDDVIRIINCCRDRGAKIALDTSGRPLKRIVHTGGIWLEKANLEELRELLGERVKDEPASLIRAGRKLLDKIEILLISRGKKGCIAVTKKAAFLGRCTNTHRKVLSTVGCGDYLLAGFLKGLKAKPNDRLVLKTAIKAATAHAWGWTETKQWPQAQRQIKVEISRL